MLITKTILVTGINLQSEPISGTLHSIYENTCIIAEKNGRLHLVKLSMADNIPEEILELNRKPKFNI